MNRISRREFIGQAVAAVGAASAFGNTGTTATQPAARTGAATRPAAGLLRASDTVSLATTGVRPSRLAMGTGTKAGREQRELGVDGLVRLLRYGLDQGVRWWETADMYQTHPHLAAALKQVKRDQIVITSKTRATDGPGVTADVERFRKELDTDYIDIVLLHCMTDGQWPQKFRGAMDALSEAKHKGHVRAVGCSCHTFEALQAAADEPWVEVNLARINPYARIMDVKEAQDVPKVVEVLETMHRRGKAIYGMKILAEGAFKDDQIDRSLHFALTKPFLSGFTVGFSSPAQLDDIIRRIEALRIRA
ncbi:MAG: aldo/keto reductase [Planctomycetes bacterium]|nr:aldo/keto reductase [Planctomycetota bacterium]